MLLDEIKDLECSLHDARRTDRQWLERVLHQDFREITRSGTLVERQETINALTAETSVLPIASCGFHLQTVDHQCIILTYKTAIMSESGPVRAALRSSCWVCNPTIGWQLLFHQGTPAAG